MVNKIILLIFWAVGVFAVIAVSQRKEDLRKPIIPESEKLLLDKFERDCKNANVEPSTENFLIWLSSHDYAIIHKDVLTKN